MRVVICGAGTAGCVAAARLSEDPGIEVVLLEAGPHYAPGAWPNELSHAFRIIKDSHDWNWFAQAGASPRLVHVPRGRVVGGSSITNATIALRGLPEHYDQWDEFVDGFGWATWLPWFRAIERDLQFGQAEFHGADGPIPINRYPRAEWYPLFERFADAALRSGHPWIDDHNAPGAVGVGPTPFNMLDGRRQTPADHYLDPALTRPNLTLLTGITCDRIRFEGQTAVAVQAISEEGSQLTVEADHVLVCLGTYSSPALLMRSGVGPASALTPHGIPVIHELNGVGNGMQDHPKVSYRFWIDTPIPAWPHPWIQVLLTAYADVGGEPRLFQVMPYVGQDTAGHRFTEINLQVADSRGRTGTIRLQGRDPRLQPVLKMGWLEDEGDRALAIAGGEALMAISRAHPLADVMRPWPNQDDSDHALRTVETFHHVVGSLRMGRPGDPTAVVDSSGGVLGLSGVSCFDASVIPRIPSANTHLAVIALTERLALDLRRRRTGGVA
jgi:choline dehydrogenase